MKNTVILSICFMMLFSLIGCGGIQEKAGETVVKISIPESENESGNEIDSDTSLSGRWYGTGERENIFSYGRSWIRDIEIDKYGRAHLLYELSTKIYPIKNTLVYAVKNGLDWVSLDDELINEIAYPHFISENFSENQDFPGRMRLDSKGRTHFFDGSLYLIWNGLGWERLDGTRAYSSNVIKPFISIPSEIFWELDSKDHPHVIYQSEKAIHYVRWNGKNWVTSDNNLYDEESNNGFILEPKGKIYDLKFYLDDDTPKLLWKVSGYDKPGVLCGIKKSESDWVNMYGADPQDFEIFDYSGENLLGWQGVWCWLDSENNLHLSWGREADENEEFPVEYCYAKYDGTSFENYLGEKLDENYVNADVPVHIDHVDERGFLYHVEYKYCGETEASGSDLALTIWNGEKWVRVDGIETTPEGDDSCIFYRNYEGGRVPTDLIIKTKGNNFYVAWLQWSNSIGVNYNLHFMEWIEEGSIPKDLYPREKEIEENLEELSAFGDWKAKQFTGKGELKQKWEIEAHSKPTERYYGVMSVPGGWYMDTNRYSVLDDRSLKRVFIDPETGETMEPIHGDVPMPGVTDGRYVYEDRCPICGFGMECWDLADGSSVWSYDYATLLGGRFYESYLVNEMLFGLAVPGSIIPTFARIDRKTGEIVWKYSFDGKKLIDYSFSKKYMFLLFDDSKIVKINLETSDLEDVETNTSNIAAINGDRNILYTLDTIGNLKQFFDDDIRESRIVEGTIEKSELWQVFIKQHGIINETSIDPIGDSHLLVTIERSDHSLNYFVVPTNTLEPIMLEGTVIKVGDQMVVYAPEIISAVDPETLEPIWWIQRSEEMGIDPKVILTDNYGVLILTEKKLICFDSE